MKPPTIATFEHPHAAVEVKFENGVTILICDTSDDPDVPESITLTATMPDSERVRLVTDEAVAPVEPVEPTPDGIDVEIARA